jgi:F-type H+/Na+-transporting ATPase subunit alpha
MNQGQEVGFVKNIRNFLIHLDGLPTVKVNDLVENEEGIRAWVSAVLKDSVEALVLDEGTIHPGQMFKYSGQKLTVPVGNFLLGHAVNPLGIPIDGKGFAAKFKAEDLREMDKTAPGINSRETISRQLDTGVTVVDTLIPIGKGQRELIIGDARSGKTDFLVDVIVNQKNTNIICIYASMGKPIAEIRGLIDILHSNKSLDYTIMVASSSSDPAPLIFLTPQTAFTIAEYFQSQGKDVLIILDDMGTHAKIYREISLLGDRAPGRESYPGDIFYQHAHLLERAGNFKKEVGGGSITALPVIELNFNDFTTFIPTNLMAMTDGHLMFKSTLYNQGQRPPIDISLSVSRVGQQTQNHLQNLLSTRVKQILAQASQLETVGSFSFELPFATRQILQQKDLINELIKQPPLTYISKELQSVLLALPFTGFFQDKDKDFIKKYHRFLTEAYASDPVLSKITRKAFTVATEEQLFELLESVTNRLIQLIEAELAASQKPAVT